MSYELYFENNPEPVVVADGYGFKAPKSWGKMVQPEPPVEAVENSLFLDIGKNPLRELDELIQREQEKLDRMILENENEMGSIQTSIGQLDIRALTASGTQRLAMIASARDLKSQKLRATRHRTSIETTEQVERVERLRELRSRKRKDLDNDN